MRMLKNFLTRFVQFVCRKVCINNFTILQTWDCCNTETNQKANSVRKCTGSSWDRVDLLHSSPYGAKLCICDQTRADSTPVFWLSLGSARTESRLSLFHPLAPTKTSARAGQEAGRGHRRDSWPEVAKGMPHTTWHRAWQ